MVSMEQEIYIDTGEKKNCLSEEVYFLEKWSDILKDDTFLSTGTALALFLFEC